MTQAQVVQGPGDRVAELVAAALALVGEAAQVLSQG